MADFKERKKEDLFIKEKRRGKNFFITSSAKMDNAKGVSKTTISSSVFTKMSQSFADGDYLLDDGIREINGSVLYMLQEMQQDIDDVYNEVSASSFQSSYFPIARIDSGSFQYISSSGQISMLTASIGGGIFTSASLAAGGGGNADFSSVGESIIPTTDNKMDLGSSTKEFKNLYIDGTAYIDSLAGTTLTAPIRTLLSQLTKMKGTTLDASATDVFEFNIAKAFTIDGIAPLFPGQEITIMNIGAGAITITRSTTPNARGIFGKTNLTIGQHEAYKFVVNQNQIWYVIS
tara:strand:- start:1675 stop:2544 length:870 start_codon:yes stop_codon:yes gene_type:complete